MQNNQDPNDTFSTLPTDIQQWLDSQSALSRMIALNNRLNLKGLRRSILPDLVFRLVTKDIDPQDFAPAVALSLNVSDNAARGITRELEKELLHPIEESLRVNVGVEVQMLHFSGDTSVTPVAPFADVARLDDKIATAPTAPIVAASPLKTEIASVVERPHNDVVAPTTPTGPVILHERKEDAAPIEQAPRPVFSIKIPTSKKQYAGTAPVAARVEVPASTNVQIPSPKEIPTTPKPPMRTLSDLHTKNEIAPPLDKPVNIIKSVAPKSMATPPAPKIIPAVAKIPMRRVVHYSEWRTLI